MRNPLRRSAWSSARTTRTVTAATGALQSRSVAATSQPPDGRGPAVSVPPNAAARSAMPGHAVPAARCRGCGRCRWHPAAGRRAPGAPVVGDPHRRCRGRRSRGAPRPRPGPRRASARWSAPPARCGRPSGRPHPRPRRAGPARSTETVEARCRGRARPAHRDRRRPGWGASGVAVAPLRPRPGVGAGPAATGSSRSTPSMRRMSVSAWRPVLDTSCIASAARSGSEACAAAAASASVTITWMLCETTSCISRAMRARSAAAASDACWSRSISRRAARSASQSSWLRSARTTTPASSAVKTRPVRKTKDLHVVARRRPADRGHDDAGLEDGGRDRDEEPVRLDAPPCRARRGATTSARAGPVTSHCTNATAGDDEEDGHRGPAPEDQREDQGGHEPKVRTARRASMNSQPEHRTKRTDGQDDVDEGGVAAVEVAQPLPDAPGPVGSAGPGRVPAPAASPADPGPEPLGIEVT